MKQKIRLFLILFLISQLSWAQSSTIENTNNTIIISGTLGCLPMGGSYNGPTASGNYVVRVEWTDFGSNPQYYQGLVSGDVLTINNYGIPGQQTMLINAQNNAGFSNQGPEPLDYFFPNDDPGNNDDEGYAFKDILDRTKIIIKTLDQSTTWIIQYENGQQISCIVLPIYVEYLTGLNSGGNGYLTWRTVDENQTGITRFEVDRTQGNAGSFWNWQWQKIATINSFNSTGYQNYNFTDLYPANTQTYYYYRVRAYRGNQMIDWDFVYISGLANQYQPGLISCNSFMSGAESLCTNSTSFYTLTNLPNYANITWTAVPFYSITNSYKFTVKESNLTRLMVVKPNVITLTANINRCSSGGTIVKYVYKGTPAILTSATSQTNTNPCSGAVVSISKTIIVTPFPGTTGSQYLWYLNNSYMGAGLTNTLMNSSNQVSNYEVRFSGPCGISKAEGTIAAVSSTGGCTPPNIVTSTTTQYVVDYCTGLPSISNTKVTISPFSCTSGSDYTWYVNGSYAGTGLTYTFNTLNYQSYTYEIRYNGPCGLSTYTGYIGMVAVARTVSFATIAPNPVTTTLSIESRRPPCNLGNLAATNTTTLVKNAVNMMTSYEIFDYSGYRVKAQEFKQAVDFVNVDVQNLKRGNYRLVIHYGDLMETKQIKLVD